METFKQVISMGRDKLISGIKYVYSDINPSTLTGAIDIIVIEQPDGKFKCGPFHVRFGKMGTLKPADKIVDIHLNGQFLDHLHMKLGSAGEAYFVETVSNNQNDTVDMSLAVSPIQSDTEDDIKDDIDVSHRAQSAENIHSVDLNFSRNNAKKRIRRQIRTKSEELPNEIGYNSDGGVDQLLHDQIDNVDRNMTWDWGNFPLETGNIVQSSKKSIDNNKVNRLSKEVYLEDISKPEVSEEMKNEYIYHPGRLIDNGYTSSEAVSPSQPSLHELRLSLCGNASAITHERFFQYLVSFEDFIKSPDDLLKNSNLVVLLNGEYFNWAVAAPILVSIVAFRTELPSATVTSLKKLHMPEKPRRSTWFSWRTEKPTPVPVAKDCSVAKESETVAKDGETVAAGKETAGASNASTVAKDDHNIIAMDTVASIDYEDDTTETSEPDKVYLKKIRLSSEEIVQLALHPGRNDVTFSMTTKYQGTTCAHAAIYLWKWYDKIVISDVDGTITKSDVLGHVLPILGRDWTQLNVVRLFNKVAQNNYRFIYLSARAIGQSGRTRTFLQDVIQDASAERLPDGPILLSPTSLFQSLHREVIEKKPEHFKIQCLNDVHSLFPSDVVPLYAGFGNRVNDVIAYRAVGIDRKRIFTVNHEGALKNEYCQRWSTSYGNLSDLVDHFFQFRPDQNLAPFSETVEDFSDVNYWCVPIDELEVRNEVNRKS